MLLHNQPLSKVITVIGPWWWSSGQRSRLMLRRSEFESRWLLNFSVIVLYEKTKINEKRPGLAQLKKKLSLLSKTCLNVFNYNSPQGNGVNLAIIGFQITFFNPRAK